MKSDIPVTSLQRLPIYLNYLKSLPAEVVNISSRAVAHALAMGEVLVRKDLAYTPAQGRTRTGYDRVELIAAIEEYLGCNDVKNAAVFGAGELGSALLAYNGFKNYGINVAAAFDSNPAKIGKTVSGKPVYGVAEAKQRLCELGVRLAVICVPAAAAQGIADLLVDCGIKGILNFAPVLLTVPDEFNVRNIDLAANLAVISSMI